MFQYRQVLVRLRAGDTVREIARSGLMGRDKLGALRAIAERQGWLDAGADVRRRKASSSPASSTSKATSCPREPSATWPTSTPRRGAG